MLPTDQDTNLLPHPKAQKTPPVDPLAIMTNKLDIEGLRKESKAEYRNLGKSGLKVSVPILGAMSIGSSAWQPWVLEEEAALPLLKDAYDRGLTTWDTGE